MIRPMEDRVVILPSVSDEKTPGGIVLPDNAKEKPMRGEVVAVGPGRHKSDGRTAGSFKDGRMVYGERIPTDLCIGDHVLYGKYAGTEVEFDGKTYVVMRETDVLGVFPA